MFVGVVPCYLRFETNTLVGDRWVRYLRPRFDRPPRINTRLIRVIDWQTALFEHRLRVPLRIPAHPARRARGVPGSAPS